MAEHPPDDDLAYCPECGGEVTIDAPHCRHCGRYITPTLSRRGGRRKALLAIIAALVLAAFFYLMLSP